MANTFFCSDHHLGHEKTCTVFKREDGSPLRPFANADEMNEAIIARHNSVVGVRDKVYFLGDVVISRRYLSLVARMNGDKVLIRGNHDIFKLEDYTQYFRDVRAYHVLNGMILSHVPVHADSLARFGTNVHGHLHANRVRKAVGVDGNGDVVYGSDIDPRYFSVCVEQIDYTPISYDAMCQRILDQGGHVGFKNGNSGVG